MRKWWQTLPGMVTATATLITAVTGLIVGLNQIGMFRGAEKPAQPVSFGGASGTPPAASSSPTAPSSAVSALPGQYVMTFPAGTEATAGKGAYKILRTRVDPRSSDKLAVTLTVRVTCVRYPNLNFFGDDFRLIVDGVPREPDEAPNLVVDLQSSKDGDVVFVIDAAAKHLVLQVGEVGHETSTIPLALAPVKQ